jgi:uroporphyrinogen decarboxylase
MTMTPKERWLAVLSGGEPDRIPMDIWSTPEATQKLMKYLKVATRQEMIERLHIDAVVTIAPDYIGPSIPKGHNMYGCHFRTAYHDGGAYDECVSHPLATYNSVEEIEKNYTWPTPDWFDYTDISNKVKQQGGDQYPIRAGGSEPFLIYTELRGMEQAYMDLALNPEMVAYCLDQLFDFCYEDTRRIYEQIPGQVTFTVVAEDLGSQQSLLFSPKTIREVFIPRMKRMMDLAHEGGATVFTHSDGAIKPIIPDLIDAGMDILNPIQWRCSGMDRESLKADFGDKVIFHGGVDNQYTLAFGSVEDVRKEVQENIEILGRDGGYILAPCHNIQVISPPENIVAMYETGYRFAP